MKKILAIAAAVVCAAAFYGCDGGSGKAEGGAGEGKLRTEQHWSGYLEY